MPVSLIEKERESLTEKEMIERISKKLENGSIILLHNGTEHTATALPKILKDISGRFKLTNISDFIYKENFTVDHTGRQIKRADLSI